MRLLLSSSKKIASSVPPVSLPPQSGTHRILHIHRNIPGVLGQINSRLSKRGLNITGQFLNTNPEIGYVILDVDSRISKEVFFGQNKQAETESKEQRMAH